MACYTETKRLEAIEDILKDASYSLFIILDKLTETFTGDPILLVELEEFLDSLDNADRTLIYLRYCGYTTGEIATEFGVSKRRIEQKLKKIRKRAYLWIG